MKGRTDLAIELTNENIESHDGIFVKANKKDDITVTEISVKNENGEKSVGKPIGDYITLEFPDLLTFCETDRIESELLSALRSIAPKNFSKILVVGLGNREITSDSIGPITAERLLATRHLIGDFAKSIGLENLKSVAVIVPNVLGKTGIETIELISSAVEKTKPDFVIAIDALCSLEASRLFSTIQLCNTGIAPGSGVKNSRKELSHATLSVPVIAVGVPTVIEANSLAREIAGKEPLKTDSLIVTPKDADFLCRKISEILSDAINRFLQPDISPDILSQLV